MVSQPCFANCIHGANGECSMDVIGSDRLSEVECACEFYKRKDSTPVTSDLPH